MIASKTIDCIICAFERPRYNLKKKVGLFVGKTFVKKKNLLNLYAGNLSMEKSLRFGMVSDVDQKITKSFGGKKSRLRRLIFSH